MLFIPQNDLLSLMPLVFASHRIFVAADFLFWNRLAEEEVEQLKKDWGRQEDEYQQQINQLQEDCNELVEKLKV